MTIQKHIGSTLLIGDCDDRELELTSMSCRNMSNMSLDEHADTVGGGYEVVPSTVPSRENFPFLMITMWSHDKQPLCMARGTDDILTAVALQNLFCNLPDVPQDRDGPKESMTSLALVAKRDHH